MFFIIHLSSNQFALFSHTKGHTFCFGSKTNQPGDLRVRFRRRSRCRKTSQVNFFDAQIEQTIFFEFTLGVEIGDQEAVGSQIVLFFELGHEADIETFRKVVHELPQVCDGRIDLHLVLPFILSPFFLEFKLCTCRLHQIIDEIDLNLVDI